MTLPHTFRPLPDDDRPPATRKSRWQSAPRKERVLVVQRRHELMERESRREVAEFFDTHRPSPLTQRQPGRLDSQEQAQR